jgi:hypothetical protein
MTEEQIRSLILQIVEQLKIVVEPDWHDDMSCVDIKLYLGEKLLSSDSCRID